MASPPALGIADKFDIQGVRVAVEWLNLEGQTSSLGCNDSESGKIMFNCHYCRTSNSAFFRLRAQLSLKGLGRKTTPFFVTISPERVATLVCDDPRAADVAEGIRNAFVGDDMLSWRFTLRQPGDLVVPPHSPLVPKKKAFWDVFDSLKTLAQATSFVVYMKQACAPSRDLLAALSGAITAGQVVTSLAHSDLTGLYDGKGGRILFGKDLIVPGPPPAESPPSYDDAGPPPPAVSDEKEPLNSASSKQQSPSSSRKRRRASSAGADMTRDASSKDKTRVEAICRKMMDEMTAKWRVEVEELGAELRHMENRIKDWMTEHLSKHVESLRAEMRQTSVELENYVDDKVGDVSIEVRECNDVVQEYAENVEDVGKKMETLRDETAEVVNERVDERVEVLRGEMEEYVADQLQDAENRVIDRLRSNLYIDFGIYE